ncbi:hypothetical protein BDK51DRAFT_41318 [Blyttiomyces helicus]|uniref:Uncharacterized protein n=1 Tax=Blyttiomyces helicus TaxID=388810 RepID=A0A4P9VZC8_9FUNG|nr:hypothetical protein BDK51DRAFT_41318 [Blyttiomyces helicus]|eukprot:RKO85124.1 hypothetical protein BDK51DRAFT_41318 [Blyttiomyces helicus]
MAGLIANHLKLHIRNVEPLLAVTMTEVDEWKSREHAADNVLSGTLSSVAELADNTSMFRSTDVMSLRIHYRDASTFREITDEVVRYERNVPDDVYVGDVDAAAIQSLANNPIPTRHMSAESKSMLQLMVCMAEGGKYAIGTEESWTDSFVGHLLNRLSFSEYPLMTQIRPRFRFAVGRAKTVSCRPSFTIFNASAPTVMIDTDKHMMRVNRNSQWGEHQIAGELLGIAWRNFNTSGPPYNKIVRGVRVIGTKFTFYKATFPEEYMMQLGNGFPRAKALIYRYPSSDTSQSHLGMDYSDPSQRKIIV